MPRVSTKNGNPPVTPKEKERAHPLFFMKIERMKTKRMR